MFGRTVTEIRRRELANALAEISNILYVLQHGSNTWDAKIKAIKAIYIKLPAVIRYMIFFKNIENRTQTDTNTLPDNDGPAAS